MDLSAASVAKKKDNPKAVEEKKKEDHKDPRYEYAYVLIVLTDTNSLTTCRVITVCRRLMNLHLQSHSSRRRLL